MWDKEDGETTALNALLRDGGVINTCIQGSSAKYIMAACVFQAQELS